MRKIGIDYGDSRFGIAVSDPMGIIASPYATYSRRNLDLDIEYVSALIIEKEADAVIFGLPVNMDGTSGGRVDKTKAFAERLKEKTGIRIEYWDERLTTVQAQRELEAMNVKKHKQKDVIDQLAAQIILRSYLESGRN